MPVGCVLNLDDISTPTFTIKRVELYTSIVARKSVAVWWMWYWFIVGLNYTTHVFSVDIAKLLWLNILCSLLDLGKCLSISLRKACGTLVDTSESFLNSFRTAGSIGFKFCDFVKILFWKQNFENIFNKTVFCWCQQFF